MCLARLSCCITNLTDFQQPFELSDCLQVHFTLCLVIKLVSLLWQAGGYFGVWTAGVAWYIAFAELLNEVWFRGRVSSNSTLFVCEIIAFVHLIVQCLYTFFTV